MPYRYILIEDSHVEGQSIFMIQIHHCFGDGITLVGVLNAAAENGFVGLTKLRAEEKPSAAVEMAGFKYGVEAFLQTLSNYNPLMSAPEDAKHRYLFSGNLLIGRMKEACKKYKMPLQPTIFAIVSQAIHEYNKRRNIK